MTQLKRSGGFKNVSKAFRFRALVLCIFTFPIILRAFPPAPYFSIYGHIRDAYGFRIAANNAIVEAKSESTVLARKAVVDGSIDYNYRMRMPIDLRLAGTLPYSSSALETGQTFTLSIEMGGLSYVPLEVEAETVLISGPAESQRIDLTLGVDTDSDGLPDEWEQSQLYYGGVLPGETGWDLSKIEPNGDFDGDGQSNYDEYIAGTYATESQDFYNLEVSDVLSDTYLLKFYAITGKVYALERSEDLQTWSRVPLRAGNSTEFTNTHTGTITGEISVYVERSTALNRSLFRLVIQ